MMKSVIVRCGKRTLGVILTGMGNDGFVACRQLHSSGGMVIAQDKASSVVYGMPRAVIDGGVAEVIAPIDRITDEILTFF